MVLSIDGSHLVHHTGCIDGGHLVWCHGDGKCINVIAKGIGHMFME